jgi:hypothetical protein
MKKLITILAMASILGSCSLPPIIDDNTEEETTETTTTTITETPITTILQIPTERRDLIANITIRDYSVGDKFEYSWTVQNNTNKEILIDNSDRNCLEYMLMFEGEKLESTKVDTDLMIKLQELGYFQMKHEANKLKTTVSNVYVEYAGNVYNVPSPLKFSYSMDVPNSILSKKGKYQMQVRLNYELEGNKYETTFKSAEFDVK